MSTNNTTALLLWLICASLMASCYSGTLIPKEERDWEAMQNIKNIEGVYANHPISKPNSINDPFWLSLKPFYRKNISREAQRKMPESHFEINILKNDKIEFILLNQDKVFATSIFKYDVVDNQIRIRSNFNYQGFPFIYYRHHCEVILLSLNTEHDLIATFKGEESGGIFVFIFGSRIDEKKIFKRMYID